ncbi:IPT/TIG domain-containing protein [Oscillochloris sp. ZM17-4]|uniref:IPT/TIG domain-containing protein n=1 Tax=Oscillochloris sp. ZM17-4 TaxID=2866714 RepID=UPI001C72FDC0|nr:IPT/TIG domain-containing protein [Oscillochloris sp. ZM17-4]MBX0329872.1 IPT/TIG domain-containing protein [Oscillochloris sp. ZM17-4]
MSLATPSRRLLAALLFIAAVIVVPALITPARGAEPGAAIITFSGTLDAGVPSRTVPLSESGPTNLRLAVSGGVASDTVTLTLLDSSAKSLKSWVARSGETIWGFASLPAGASLRVQTSGASLSFDLSAYARGTVAAPSAASDSWSGVVIGAAAQTSSSDGQFVAPAAGLYTFTLGADSGAYQLVIDGDYLRKTVVSGSLPSASDSTYYLSAGNHSFQIVSDSSAGVSTRWSVQMVAAGAIDSLPSTESASMLGGSTGDGAFVEEWVPIQTAAAHTVNIRIAAIGAAIDTFQVELYTGGAKVLTSSDVAGGEVVWVSSALGAGANALHIVTKAGNSAPLGYSLTVSDLFTPKLSWSGISFGSSQTRSTARASFATAGLYTFTLGAESGRYQISLNDTYLRKVVTTAGVTFSAYVPAGTHTLEITQEGAGSTAWSVTIEAAKAAVDTLPYARSGALLGGAGNDFGDESLPIQLAATTPINIRVTATDGGPNDSLRVEIFEADAATPSFSAAAVYKGEVLWATSSLPEGTSLLRVSAAAGNSAPMSYAVEISGVGTIPLTWSGVARGEGINSAITLTAPEDGVYTVTLTLASGNGQVIIDGGTPQTKAAARVNSANLTLRVPLRAGPHHFAFIQDTTQVSTSWQIATSLLQKAVPLSITAIMPPQLSYGTGGTMTISGAGFESGTVVTVLDSAKKTVSSSAVVVSGTEIMLTLPATTPPGTYSLSLTNPNGDALSMNSALSVGLLRTFMPLVYR